MTEHQDTWPEEEAVAEAETFLEMLPVYEKEGIAERTLSGIYDHWNKVFGNADDLGRFIKEWNKHVLQQKYQFTTFGE